MLNLRQHPPRRPGIPKERNAVTFPVMFHLFGRAIHPHAVMEGLAYAAAFGVHFVLRQRVKSADVRVPVDVRLWLFAGITTGALAGAKVVQVFETWFVRPAAGPGSMAGWLEGKTIVGGMIGAWVAILLCVVALGALSIGVCSTERFSMH